jgi:hypothetical protein
MRMLVMTAFESLTRFGMGAYMVSYMHVDHERHSQQQ